MSLTIAKQYKIIGAYTDLPKKSGRMPDIRIWREKNKPKIRICQSGTDMQTLLVGQGPTSLPNGRMDCVRRIVCITGPTSAPANGSVVVTIDNHPAVVPFAYKVRAK